MSQRLKLVVAYDGAFFAGWQSQAHGNTVQDRLEAAFQRVNGHPVRVHGAGRTDTGVHALAQTAHVDLAGHERSPQEWMAALNALLPSAVRIVRCAQVSAKFHARFSAKGKVYRYRISAAPVLSPFEQGRVWHVIQPLDLGRMKAAAEKFVGKHDFVAFAANRGKAIGDTVRTLKTVKVRARGPLVEIEIEGDGFLYKMVRMMVGSLVQCAQGKISLGQVGERLKSRQVDQARLVAPATGLFLIRVRY
jgi:tRNA pseudouridine38-40 synthase